MKVLIASNNRGKLREIQALLRGIDVELVSPFDLGLVCDVEETGHTYAENAALKAKAFQVASGLPSLADDSGLEVQALHGQPGIHSARFSPLPGATDADRRSFLLKRLKGHPRPWLARFVCTIALASPGDEIQYSQGECEGEIIPQERGHNGFGYDPIFFLPDLGKTMAELDDDVKNRVSHRSRAVLAAIPSLTKLIKTVG